MAGLGLILPIRSANAGIESLIGAAFVAATGILTGFFLNLISFITAGLVSMAAAILNSVVSLDFKYTSGGIVDVGWPIVRDLTNMFFVVILVFIGLAVALRLRDYEAKKVLIPLIIIALLINFTPVIMGLIVDASNIFMNFFLKDLNPGSYFEAHMKVQASILPTGWSALNPFKYMEQTMVAVTLIFLDIIVFFILLLYATLFMVRYVAIWVLVILSPIALACYILPNTRKYWTQWWNQFIQWCIIGIVAGFFLYLGSHIFSVATTLFVEPPPDASLMQKMTIKIMPLIVIMILYIIGLFTAFSTSAAGAGQIISGFQRGAKATGSVAWRGMKASSGAIVRAERAALMGAAGGISKGTKAYGIVHGSGWTRKQAFSAGLDRGLDEFKTGMGKAVPPRPAGGYGKATARGLQKAITEIVGATIGKGLWKKKKGEPCVRCKKPMRQDSNYCQECGAKQ